MGEAPKVSMKTAVLNCVDGFGYTVDEDQLSKGFFDLGMDSVEVGEVRQKLSSTLGVNLPNTLLFDFPSVLELSQELDRRLGSGPEDATQGEQQEQQLSRDVLECLDTQAFVMLQKSYRKAVLHPEVQFYFEKKARECYPDHLRYLTVIGPKLDEMQGQVLLDFGLIQDVNKETVQDALVRLADVQFKLSSTSKDVRDLAMEILRITKQGATLLQ